MASKFFAQYKRKKEKIKGVVFVVHAKGFFSDAT